MRIETLLDWLELSDIKIVDGALCVYLMVWNNDHKVWIPAVAGRELNPAHSYSLNLSHGHLIPLIVRDGVKEPVQSGEKDDA